MTLEKCLEFINDDELLEVTQSLRMRKAVLSAKIKQKSRGRNISITAFSDLFPLYVLLKNWKY